MKNSVKLRQRARANGTASLYLDIYYGSTANVDKASGKLTYKSIRERKVIDGYLYLVPKNKDERTHNKTALALAEEIRRQEEYRLASSLILDKSDISSDNDFYVYYNDYVECYQKKDKRHLTRALALFQEFLGSVRKYRHYKKKLEFNAITRQMIEGFTAFLKARFKGEGTHTVFARFKKVLKNAVIDGIIPRNPCEGVVISCDQGQIKKDTLTKEEIGKLINTHYQGENEIIRRAFIFCLFTGIRGCDVRNLSFENYSPADQMLRFTQLKTDGRSSASMVAIPMTQLHRELIGLIPADQKTKIFQLPTDTTCNHHLRRWTLAAGINKHITWHCARHSFGTNLCEDGINPMAIMSLMGHSSLKYTTRYVRVRDKAKINALESLCSSMNTDPK